LSLPTRFRGIHFKPHTEEEFVEIVVNVLDREGGVDRDMALLITDGVYNKLKSKFNFFINFPLYAFAIVLCSKIILDTYLSHF
jgi:hypothetical protein